MPRVRIETSTVDAMAVKKMANDSRDDDDEGAAERHRNRCIDSMGVETYFLLAFTL